MDFYEEKKIRLGRKDRSRKGTVDGHIKKLVTLINKQENYYTTSSCSGRILLIVRPKSGRKCDTEWLLVSHEPISYDKIRKTLTNLPIEDVWLRQEPFILHVCCKTIDDANLLLIRTLEAGLKRSGIITLKKRIVVEIMGTDYMDSLIAKNGKLVVPQTYLKLSIAEANKRLKKNLKRIKKLELLS
jgi:tRNA wybutosine-synthesizing protein 3